MQDLASQRSDIEGGRTALGIEFGSTRIKAVLVDSTCEPVASGSFEWENSLVDGYWTYGQDEVLDGLAACYGALKADVADRLGVTLTKVGSLGVSAMMHGYLAFDGHGRLLVPFRTWRNVTADRAARELSRAFGFHIPARWSVAHLYQALLDDEPHVAEVASITTLAGYVHRLLTGRDVLSVGDASGVFPVDGAARDYDRSLAAVFDALPAVAARSVSVLDLLPEVLVAGQEAGRLTEAGARLLDPAGDLESGCPCCPPEGDAGTGMIATNAVAPRTGNVSAGTSVFSMVVLDGPLPDPAQEAIDLVATPEGDPVAMVHCNNCTSDLNAWMGLFRSYNELMGVQVDDGELFGRLFGAAMDGAPDGGSLVSVPFVSGEPVVGVAEGAPLFTRGSTAKMDIATFMRAQLMGAFGALKAGNDVLRAQGVEVDRLYGHGGIFKTPLAAQTVLAAALGAPVTVLSTAGEGGAWGQALAARFLVDRREGQSLASWLDERVFGALESATVEPDPADVSGFDVFLDGFLAACALES